MKELKPECFENYLYIMMKKGTFYQKQNSLPLSFKMYTKNKPVRKIKDYESQAFAL